MECFEIKNGVLAQYLIISIKFQKLYDLLNVLGVFLRIQSVILIDQLICTTKHA